MNAEKAVKIGEGVSKLLNLTSLNLNFTYNLIYRNIYNLISSQIIKNLEK